MNVFEKFHLEVLLGVNPFGLYFLILKTWKSKGFQIPWTEGEDVSQERILVFIFNGTFASALCKVFGSSLYTSRRPDVSRRVFF